MEPQQPADLTVTLRGGRSVPLDQAVQMVRRSTGWFFWIAGLSVVNWIAIALNLNYAMILGLGVTRIVTAIAIAGGRESNSLYVPLMVVSFVVTMLVAGTFVVLGYQARQLRLWAQIAGAVLYAADALVFVVLQDWIAVAFHAFVMFMLWTGISTTLAIKQARTRAVSIGSLPNE